MENNIRRGADQNAVVDLTGLPTEYIKKVIIANPDDPRFSEALKELYNREISMNVPEIPDHVIAEVFEKNLGPSDFYEKIPWMRSTSLQALSYLNPEKSRDMGEAYEITLKGVCWRFSRKKVNDNKVKDVWVLISVR